MAKKGTVFQLQPITPEEISDTPFALAVPPDILQLQADTINVLEGAIDIKSFPLEYQNKIRNFYRFSADQFTSTQNLKIARDRTTGDIL